jgi:hypothetical protein
MTIVLHNDPVTRDDALVMRTYEARSDIFDDREFLVANTRELRVYRLCGTACMSRVATHRVKDAALKTSCRAVVARRMCPSRSQTGPNSVSISSCYRNFADLMAN